MASFFSTFLSERLILTSFIVGVGGVCLFLHFAYRRMFFRRLFRHLRSSSPVLHDIVASAQPEVALRKAIDHISRGDITTLGGLVCFFRGSNNEKAIRLDSTFHSYLRCWLDSKVSSFSGASPELRGDARTCEMLRQLCRCAEQATRLEEERTTPFDAGNPEHMRLLRGLWEAAGKSPARFSQRSEEWAELGFQGLDPATDLRGGGVLALRQFVDFAHRHNNEFREMMAFNKKTLAAGKQSWYPIALVSIQLTAHLLLQQNYKFYLPQLEVLYDTVEADCDRSVGRHVGSLHPAVLRRRGNHKKTMCGFSKENSDVVWKEERDFEVGFNTLHHQLLLHFKTNWHRDLPNVMQYANYSTTVFRTFFVQD